MDGRKSNISEYRIELMGIGALGVLLTHSSGIIDWPSSIQHFVSYGGLGVYFFTFLSGVGLYYSLKNRGEGYSKADFYKRRLWRVFIPYLIIAGIWYGIKYIIVEHSLVNFFYELSTLSYWFEHKGAWYVAALIPIYLVYPLFYDWTEKGFRGIKTVCTIITVLVVETLLFHVRPSLYTHLVQVLNALWVFVLGHFCAEQIRDKRSDCLIFLPVTLVVIIIEKMLPLQDVLPIGGIIYALKGCSILVVSGFILRWVNVRSLHMGLCRIGRLSLELYLTNIFAIQMLRYFHLDTTINMQFEKYGGFVQYAVVLAIGAVLAVITNQVGQRSQHRV